MHELLRALLDPRGILSLIFVSLFYYIPIRLLETSKSIHDKLNLVIIDGIRFILSIIMLYSSVGDAQLYKNRSIVRISENISYYNAVWTNFTVSKTNKGVWILDKGMQLPPFLSNDWKDIVIVFWIHGGGFCVGSCYSMMHAHTRVIHKFNSTSHKSKLVYFAVEYPSAPNVSLGQIRQSILKEFNWLLETIKGSKVVIAGDSAGGNLTIGLIKDLSLSDYYSNGIIATILISPLVDLSLSETTIFSQSCDFLNVEILKVWINCALYQSSSTILGKEYEKMDPNFSPLYSDFFELPNPMIIYSCGEVLAPGIEKWIQKYKAHSPILVLNEPGMAHDYVLFGSVMHSSSDMGFKSNFGLDLMANHILRALNG